MPRPAGTLHARPVQYNYRCDVASQWQRQLCDKYFIVFQLGLNKFGFDYNGFKQVVLRKPSALLSDSNASVSFTRAHARQGITSPASAP